MTQIRTGNVNPNTRLRMHTACLKVRNVLGTDSQFIVVRKAYDYGIDITYLFEVRIPNADRRCIQVLQKRTSSWMHRSGPEDNAGLRGVAIAMNNGAHSILIS